MTGPTLVRLFHGRLWHVQQTTDPAIAFCGEPLDLTTAETLVSTVPANAWVCPRCVAEVNRYRLVVLGIALGDPRTNAHEHLLDLTEEVAKPHG